MASLLVYAKDAMPSKQSKWHHLYNTPQWKRGRVEFLSDPAHMFCVMCKEAGRKYVQATIVDHIKPHKGNEKLFYARTNWQGLCKHCHDGLKSLQESHGYTMGCDVYGNPIDKGHPWNK